MYESTLRRYWPGGNESRLLYEMQQYVLCFSIQILDIHILTTADTDYHLCETATDITQNMSLM